tara:strand:+ start:740 stop:2107 length:1368 start_codon:yes stop_codon:yes gene_type:complete
MPELVKSIFREYDIRGIYPDELNEDSIAEISKSIAKKCHKESIDEVVIARDGRLSGPSLLESLQESLNKHGINTINIGLATSPLLYYAAKKQVSKSGIMITGSHNPKNYNGIKLVINDKPVSGTEIFELSKTDISSENSNGENRFLDIKDEYITEVKNSFNFKKLKVVVDCGNGAAGVIAPNLLRAVGCEVIEIFCDVDGNFPNHHPDPGKEKNLVDLIEKVKEVSADVGVAFDGDGDRLGAVTSSGRLIYPDQMMMLFSKKILSNEGDKTIIFDVKCSDFLPQIIKENDGIPFMSPTGHFHIKNNIKKHNAALGGEMSGHIFFNDIWHGFDDGHYSAVRLLDIMNETGSSLDDLLDSLPVSYSTPELNIDVPEERKFQIIEDFIENASIDGEKDFTDGLRASFENGWALLRASNTTPKLVLRFEADSQESLEKIQNNFLEELKKFLPNEDINLE